MNLLEEKSTDKFYVYAYLRACGTPFYVGKGSGGRYRFLARRNPIFTRILSKIRKSGDSYSVAILHNNLSEEEAFKIERLEIQKYGRLNIGTGILSNLTDGGEGPSGAVFSDEAKTKISDANRRLPPRQGFKGVTFNKASGKWRAAIRTDGKQKFLGSFVTEKDAAIAYDAAAFCAWGLDCFINLPSLLSTSPVHRRSKSEVQRMLPPRVGFKGVRFNKSTGEWSAKITIKGKKRNLGVFASEECAARAYDAAAFVAWGDACYLNFPEYLSLGPPERRTKSEASRMKKPKEGYKGVSFHKDSKMWRAAIQVDGKNRYIGIYRAPEDAARAYDAAAYEAWGDKCYLNFPLSTNDNQQQVADLFGAHQH